MTDRTNRNSGGCPAKAELSAYVDGELSAELQAAIESHLTACTDCREYLRELKRTSETLRHLFQEAANQIIVPEESRAPRRAIGYRRWVIGAAVAAAALVFAVVLFLCLKRPEERRQQPSQDSVARKPEESAPQEVIRPSEWDMTLRADTLSLALAGDLEAQILLYRLGLDGELLKPVEKVVSAPPLTIEEMEANRARFRQLYLRMMGGER